MEDVGTKGRACMVLRLTELDEKGYDPDALPGLAGVEMGIHESRNR